MVDFAGFELPVTYETGLVKEHEATRNAAAIFDVSHMGEIIVKGSGALASLNHILTNDFTNMQPGRCRYSPMCYENGGMVDDLIVYMLDQNSYLIVVNASNKDKDYKWICENLLCDTTAEDISDTVAQIAVQGPHAVEICNRIGKPEEFPTKYYTFTREMEIAGAKCLVSKTGYTGEDGYEIYTSCADAPKIWEALLEAGKPEGLIPAALGARDTLRFEASMPLYGHEMDESVNPLEAGLNFGVKMDKENFIGKEAIEKSSSNRKRVGLKITGRGIVREEAPVFFGDQQIGMTTSGTHCPTLGGAYAMALIDGAHSELGTYLECEVRGRRIAAEVVAMPFYKRAK